MSGWISRGVIREPALTTDGRIVPKLAVAQLRAAGYFADAGETVAAVAAVARAETAAADGSPPEPITYDQARTATQALKAHRALLDLRERHGELVERRLAEGLMFDGVRAIRDSFHNWPARVAPEMAARLAVDPALLLSELEKAVRRQLRELADPGAGWLQRSRERLTGRP